MKIISLLSMIIIAALVMVVQAKPPPTKNPRRQGVHGRPNIPARRPTLEPTKPVKPSFPTAGPTHSPSVSPSSPPTSAFPSTARPTNHKRIAPHKPHH
jgi:hypothetical protein